MNKRLCNAAETAVLSSRTPSLQLPVVTPASLQLSVATTLFGPIFTAMEATISSMAVSRSLEEMAPAAHVQKSLLLMNRQGDVHQARDVRALVVVHVVNLVFIRGNPVISVGDAAVVR